MQTKFSTGQAILIPAVIRSAREQNGQIVYDIDANIWDGVPEDAIVIDNEAAARAAYDKALTEMSRMIY